MKLLELIPTTHTLPEITDTIQQFAEHCLGKGVVIARDTPNFIANRIGTYSIQVTIQAMEKSGLSPTMVDALTGTLLGRPKSATFRTLDIVGLDTYAHVVRNMQQQLTDRDEIAAFQLPSSIEQLISKGALGEKTKQGFYRKRNGIIQVLNLETWQYEPQQKPKLTTRIPNKREKTLGKRLQTIFAQRDPISHFLWEITKRMLLYTAQVTPTIANTFSDVDRAMRWGFNWELGPFELWDQLGVADTVKRMKTEGETIPDWVEQHLLSGQSTFYQKPSSLPLSRSTNKIASNAGATVIDIGDDVACFIFHSPKQAIGNDTLEMLDVAITEVENNYRGLVVTGEGTNFSVGANLMMMLLLLEDRDYEAIDQMILRFQTTLSKLRTCSRPVVAAPFGLTLGGGVEMCLPADAIQASAETYMGLVETGAGLIPAGGGCKEMLLRIYEQTKATDARVMEPFVYQLFDTIGKAKVSTSGLEAKSLGFLRSSDQVSMNRDHLVADAKRRVLSLTHTYRPPQISKIPILGSNGTHTMKLAAYQLYRSGYLSAHDYKIASKLAYVLAGGEVPENTLVSTNYLLELEREAFLSLIGEPKTQARMAHLLRTGKPLRN
jgi:3-hydroxyacyl-CoA dehydrogenase